MFWDYCPLIDDAWGHYYHNQNYAIWQQNADRIYTLTRKCMTEKKLKNPQILAAMRVRKAAQKQRDADAAEEAAQKSRAAAAEEAAVHGQLTCDVNVWGDIDMLDLDDCVLDV
jgi:hypothetical protein